MSHSVKLRVKLTSAKKLLIGGGGGAQVLHADISHVRIARGEGGSSPAIPGSTVKGVLRSSLIRIASLLGHEAVSPSVTPSKLAANGDVVSRLFGAPHANVSGKVRVRTTLLDGVKAKPVSLRHVRIADDSGTADEGALFSAEYLPIGETFTVELEAANLELDEAQALFVALAELQHERIGRSSALSIRILRDGSVIPAELLQDPIVGEVWRSLSDESV